MVLKVEEKTGKLPEKALADAGYFSETAVTDERLAKLELFVPPDRQKHGQQEATPSESTNTGASVADEMRAKLRTEAGAEVYRLRKTGSRAGVRADQGGA